MGDLNQGCAGMVGIVLGLLALGLFNRWRQSRQQANQPDKQLGPDEETNSSDSP